MATIQLSYVLSDMRRRVGNTVFSKAGITNYVREYHKRSSPDTAKNRAIRSAFSAAVTTWEFLPKIMKQSWPNEYKTKGLSAYNNFIKANGPKLNAGESLVLTERIGELPLETLACATGAAGEIQVKFTLPYGVTGKNVVFFIQKMQGNAPVGYPRIMETGVGGASPFTLSGLETGAEYTVYGVVTDAMLVDAKTVSVSGAGKGVAG